MSSGPGPAPTEARADALGGSGGAPLTTGGDYACRERVFAPPAGTVDVDWLTPAVLEAHPALDQPQARAAVQRAWTAVQLLAAASAAAGGSGRHDDVSPAAALARISQARPVGPADRTAVAVVLDAVRLFGSH